MKTHFASRETLEKKGNTKLYKRKKQLHFSLKNSKKGVKKRQ